MFVQTRLFDRFKHTRNVVEEIKAQQFEKKKQTKQTLLPVASDNTYRTHAIIVEFLRVLDVVEILFSDSLSFLLFCILKKRESLKVFFLLKSKDAPSQRLHTRDYERVRAV